MYSNEMELKLFSIADLMIFVSFIYHIMKRTAAMRQGEIPENGKRKYQKIPPVHGVKDNIYALIYI